MGENHDGYKEFMIATELHSASRHVYHSGLKANRVLITQWLTSSLNVDTTLHSARRITSLARPDGLLPHKGQDASHLTPDSLDHSSRANHHLHAPLFIISLAIEPQTIRFDGLRVMMRQAENSGKASGHPYANPGYGSSVPRQWMAIGRVLSHYRLAGKTAEISCSECRVGSSLNANQWPGASGRAREPVVAGSLCSEISFSISLFPAGAIDERWVEGSKRTGM